MLRPIPNYENYLINESGVVIDTRTNDMVRISADNSGYMYVTLNENIEYIHELVAKSFLIPYQNAIYPIHVDGDPMNNHISNIRYSVNPEVVPNIINREKRHYSKTTYYYEVYNNETGNSVICGGRGEVARLIQYEEISLKNMIGNGRKITLGPYKGYQIRKLGKVL